MTIEKYLKVTYPGEKAKPKFKVGQVVRFTSNDLRGKNGVTTRGKGTITRVFAAYGNMPTNYEVSTFSKGVLFEYELKAAA